MKKWWSTKAPKLEEELQVSRNNKPLQNPAPYCPRPTHMIQGSPFASCTAALEPSPSAQSLVDVASGFVCLAEMEAWAGMSRKCGLRALCFTKQAAKNDRTPCRLADGNQKILTLTCAGARPTFQATHQAMVRQASQGQQCGLSGSRVCEMLMS